MLIEQYNFVKFVLSILHLKLKFIFKHEFNILFYKLITSRKIELG